MSNRLRNIAAARSASSHLLRAALLAVLATAAAAQPAENPSLEQLEVHRMPDCDDSSSDNPCTDSADAATDGATDAAAQTRDTRDIARRAAIRQRNVEQRALRELLLQRACHNRKAYCAHNAAPGCAEQLAQMCTAAEQQAEACKRQAVSYCTTFPQIPDCVRQRLAQCPSARRQTVDALLAKYPQLSAQQVEHVKSVARQMDANIGSSWVGDLFRWLGLSS